MNKDELDIIQLIVAKRDALSSPRRVDYARYLSTEYDESYFLVCQKLTHILEAEEWGKFARRALFQESLAGRRKYLQDVTSYVSDDTPRQDLSAPEDVSA